MRTPRSSRRLRTVLVLATAAAVALGAGVPATAAAPAGVVQEQPDPGTAQREATYDLPLPGDYSRAAVDAPITREEVLARAKTWVDAKVPYSNYDYRDGYRQDCSGFVSFAWALGASRTTDSLDEVGTPIAKADLQPGDVLLWQNPNWPAEMGHVRIFGGWLTADESTYWVYEQTPPNAVRDEYSWAATYPTYKPYRYKNIIATSATLTGTTSDVTGDGRPDVIARDGGGNLWVYPHDGRTGVYAAFTPRYSAGNGWNLATALT
ncbi:hypothetical protein ACQPYE_19010 [Actinosynnema sp. CA-299493]